MRKITLDFVFKNVNYEATVQRSDGLILKLLKCDEEGDWVEMDGDIPRDLDEACSQEWQAYLAENGLELDWV